MKNNTPLSPLNDTEILTSQKNPDTHSSEERTHSPSRNTHSQEQNDEKLSEEIRSSTEQDNPPESHRKTQNTEPEEHEASSPDQEPQASEYSTYSRVPVGFDLVTLTYQLTPEEELLTEGTVFWLLKDQLRVEVNLLPYPLICLSFNANTLNDKHRYLPLSLSEYAKNFQLIESEVRWHVLTTFTIARCNIFKIELFKTLHMDCNVFDYSKAINMLNVKGAYLKNLKYHSEGTSTFSLKNGKHELMFYDKHLELKDKVKGKKEILRALPEEMMRIEWKFRHPSAIGSKLKIKWCRDLIDNYTSIAKSYTEHCANILPKIRNPPNLQINFASSDMQAISNAMKATYGKQADRYATEAMLAYYLVKEHGLDNYYNTAKASREQSNNLNARIKRWIPLVAHIGPVKCIDLYNELRGGLLDNSEVSDD